MTRKASSLGPGHYADTTPNPSPSCGGGDDGRALPFADRDDIGHGYEAHVSSFAGLGGRTVRVFRRGSAVEARRFKVVGGVSIAIENARECARVLSVDPGAYSMRIRPLNAGWTVAIILDGKTIDTDYTEDEPTLHAQAMILRHAQTRR